MYELLFLLFSFGILTILALVMTGSDYFNPAVVVPLVFLLCSFAALYNFCFHETEVSLDAACVLLLTTAILSISSFCAYRLVVGKDAPSRNWTPTVRVLEIPSWLLLVAIAFCIVATVIYYRDLMRSMSALGFSGDWNQMMQSYRFATSFREIEEGEGVSGIANMLYKVMTAFAFFFAYAGINNLILDRGHRMRHLALFLPAMTLCVCIVFTGGRMGLIRLALGCALIAWVIFNSMTKWSHRLKISAVLKAAALIIIASVAFWAIGSAVGRQITTGPLDYITSYIGYSMVLFSDFLSDLGSSVNNLFGLETLVGIYNFIGTHFGIDEFVYTYHMEWRYFGNLSLGNVYTAYRYWLHDFGFAGMFAMALFYGLFYGVCYAKVRCYRNKFRRTINYPLLMVSYLYYGVFLIPIKDCLLATELVVTTPFVLVAMYLLGRLVDARQNFSDASTEERLSAQSVDRSGIGSAGCGHASRVMSVWLQKR